MGKIKKINRLWLKNQILKGNVEGRCDYRYSDDYAWDAATNFGKTDWLPCRITHPHEDEYGRWTNDHLEGYINFRNSDFRGYGSCWADNDELGKNGPMSLYFGYRSYTLRLINKIKIKEAA